MRNIATAYMARRYASGGKARHSSEKMMPAERMAEGGMAEMCEHGGPIKCAMGCYDEGGEVHGLYGDAEGFADNEDELTGEGREQEHFDADIEDHEDNERGDMGSSIDHEDESEGTKKYAKGGMILKKILGGISKRHTGR